MNTVSYTHLDVYKRQVVYGMIIVEPRFAETQPPEPEIVLLNVTLL